MDGISAIGRKLRLGIVGVGNCASSLVQGISFYGPSDSNAPVPGLPTGIRCSDFASRRFGIAAKTAINSVQEAVKVWRVLL